MSTFLKEISATEVNLETKNGGASSWCAHYAATAAISAGLCAAGNKCGCTDYQNAVSFMSKYCK